MKNKYKLKPKRVFSYFFKKSIAEKRRLLIIIIGIIFTTISSVMLPLFYTRIIDVIGNYTGGDKTIIMNSLFHIFFIIIIIEIIKFISWRLVDLGIVKFELNTMKRIFKECFDYLHQHSYRFFTNSFGGALVKKINRLVYSFEDISDIFIFEIMRLGISLPLIIGTIMFANFYLGLIFLIWIISYCIIQYFLYKWHLPFTIEASEEDSKVTGVLADTITNHFNILTFASNKRESNYFVNTTKQRGYKSKKSWNNQIIIHIINAILISIFELVILYFAIIFRGKDLITMGTIVLLQMYLLKIVSQIFAIGNIFKRLYKAIGKSSEMLDILDTKHEIQDKKDAKILNITNGIIEFKNVYFQYQKEGVLFNNFSLKINKGEKLALVGYSGAGKTTIIKLLFRFFDIQKGEILIDGQNISNVTQESLRSNISIIPQDPILFHRSLKENIAYGKPDASMEKIIEASKKAKCHDFILDLEKGYDTSVGERGIKLSGGERQRVAIARAILENKKILILDEATSSLDSESEKFIQEAMKKLMENKTTIIIAHRLSTIMEMDRIVVIKQGKIIEEGGHKQLLKNTKGIYKKLRNIQSGCFIE